MEKYNEEAAPLVISDRQEPLHSARESDIGLCEEGGGQEQTKQQQQRPSFTADLPFTIMLREVWGDFFMSRVKGDHVEIDAFTEEMRYEAEEDYYNLPHSPPDFSHFVLFKEGWWKVWAAIFSCGMVTYALCVPTLVIVFAVLILKEVDHEQEYRQGQADASYDPPQCLLPPFFGGCSFFGEPEPSKYGITRALLNFSHNSNADSTLFIPGDALCPVSFTCTISDPTIVRNGTVIHNGSATMHGQPVIYTEEFLLGSFFLSPAMTNLFSASSNLEELKALCPTLYGLTPPAVAWVALQSAFGAASNILINFLNAWSPVSAFVTAVTTSASMTGFYIRHRLPCGFLRPAEASARVQLRALFDEITKASRVTSRFGVAEKILRMSPLLGFKCTLSLILGVYSGIKAAYSTPDFENRTLWDRYSIVAIIFYNGALMKTMADFATMYMCHKVVVEYRKADAALFNLSRSGVCCGRFNIFYLIAIGFRHTYSITFDLMTTAYSVFSHVLRCQFADAKTAGGEAAPLGGVIFSFIWGLFSAPFIVSHMLPGGMVNLPGMCALLGGLLLLGALPCLCVLLISLDCRIERSRPSKRLKEGYYLPVYQNSACSWVTVIIQTTVSLVVATLVCCLGISFCVNLAVQMYDQHAYYNTVPGYFSAIFRQFELRSQTCYMMNVHANIFATIQHYIALV